MKIQLIRNATLRLSMAQQVILIDPFLGPKHSIPSFADISPNPLVDLPCTPEEIMSGVGLVLISHLHPDHFDPTAQEQLSKDGPIVCQPCDAAALTGMGFTNVIPVETTHSWEGITLMRTPGQHGTGEWVERMGPVSGFVFQAAGEPTLYWAGDTIWYEVVAQVIRDHQPQLIITHSGGARLANSDPIIMDAEQTIAICQAAGQAKVIAVHLEALDHCTTSRADLRSLAEQHGISQDQLWIPADGAIMDFPVQPTS